MRRFGWGLVAGAALLLAGCGGNDATQRKAFVTFLQTRILDKPGVHVPQLTDADKASFGRYADQYAIITGFNRTLDQSVSPRLASAMSAGSITSIGDVVTHRGQLQAAKASIDAMAGVLGSDLAQADAAHARLDQPADLKPVYDQAYDRLVTRPAAAFKGIVPVMDRVLAQAADLGTYLDAHRAAVNISGPLVETSDPAVRAAVNDKLQALQANQQEVLAAQTRFQSVIYGTGG